VHFESKILVLDDFFPVWFWHVCILSNRAHTRKQLSNMRPVKAPPDPIQYYLELWDFTVDQQREGVPSFPKRTAELGEKSFIVTSEPARRLPMSPLSVI